MPEKIRRPTTNSRPTLGRICPLAEPGARPIHAEPVQSSYVHAARAVVSFAPASACEPADGTD